MATYKEIIAYIRKHHDVTVETCCIAKVKAEYNLTRGHALNRKDPTKLGKFCPLDERPFIVEALKHFDMI